MRNFRITTRHYALAGLITASVMTSFWLSHGTRAQEVSKVRAAPPPLDTRPTATIEDPVQAVESFVDEGQKLAETQLIRLKSEEAAILVRLQKVQAGIKRWQSVAEALKSSKNGPVAITGVVTMPHADTPSDLSAIPQIPDQVTPRK